MESKVVAVLGAQWGDEGKGKLVDLLAKDADLVCRFNGGSNAGANTSKIKSAGEKKLTERIGDSFVFILWKISFLVY